jgi:hypothetical protein
LKTCQNPLSEAKNTSNLSETFRLIGTWKNVKEFAGKTGYADGNGRISATGCRSPQVIPAA